MIDDYKPIIFNTDKRFSEIELYIISDLHVGSELFDEELWQAFKKQIIEKDNRYVIIGGDMFEFATRTSKGNPYTQTLPPHLQKEWLIRELHDIKDRIVCMIPGNHEGRSNREVDLYPLYDVATILGISKVYRENFAVLDLGVGERDGNKQIRYVGYIIHKAKNNITYGVADSLEGFDFVVYGHDHRPHELARRKLTYDTKNKCVRLKNIENIDSGSFMTFGGYGAKSGYRPQSDKKYKIILDGNKKNNITTVGFYL